jgi:hypothetical protein
MARSATTARGTLVRRPAAINRRRVCRPALQFGGPYPLRVDDELPANLTPDEAFRAAFYMSLGYISRGVAPASDLVLYAQYL